MWSLWNFFLSFSSATWSLGKAELLKQCLAQRCCPETADRMGPTRRFNENSCFRESALPFSSAEEWVQKERKYQDTSQYMAWFNKTHSTSNSREECLECGSVILSQRFVFKSINCAVCKKNIILPIAAVLLCLDTDQWIFVYGQELGIIYATSCGYPSNQTHWWRLQEWFHKIFKCLGI